MRIVFFGTPDFSAEVLDYLLENKIEIAAVISKPDKPKGRSLNLEVTAVKKLIQSKYSFIPLFQPEKVSDLTFKPVLEALNPDLFVVVAYGEIIKQHLLEMPRIGCINLHTSLLPKYRGAAPIQRAILAGEKESGVTVMHMVKQMDAGDIIDQEKIEIPLEMNFGELEKQMVEKGKKLLLNSIQEGSFPRTPQNTDLVTLAPKIELEECELDWNKSALSLHNLVRGVNPEPGAWVSIKVKDQIKRLKIFKTYPLTESGVPGALLNLSKKRFIVSTSDGSLEILEVQLEGKKRMSASDLLNGFSHISFTKI